MVRAFMVPAIAGAIAFTSSAASAREVAMRNGNFEANAPRTSWLSINAGGRVPGWRVTSGTVDVVGGYWRAYDGLGSLEVGSPGAAAIEQTIQTTPGRRYVLRFALAGNPDGSPRRKLLDVRAGTTSQRFVFDTDGKTRASMGWIVEQLPFVAVETATTIRFARPDGGATAWWGPVIDAVSVAQVDSAPPQPAAALPHAPQHRPAAPPPPHRPAAPPPPPDLSASKPSAATSMGASARGMLVRNSGFEANAPRSSWLSVDARGTVPGWRVTSGTVDVVGGYWRAYDRLGSLEVGSPGAAAVEQTIHTTPGRGYVLRFALAGNPDGPPRRKLLDVRAGTTTRRFAFDTRGKTRASMGWRIERLAFTARDTVTTIRFARPDGGATDWWGPVIDGVAVVEASPPQAHRAGAFHRAPPPRTHPPAMVHHAPPPRAAMSRPRISSRAFGWGCPDC
jgi:choice-of-anchor C domain-containing protein